MFKLRDYQQRVVDEATTYLSKSIDSCVIEAATGSGKSLMVAEIAKWVHDKSGKRVLCLAPTKELVEQNADKYRAYGLKCSLFSASLNQKSLRHYVVFGSPQSVKNSIDRFKNFAAVIIDECHGITKTVKHIIDHLKHQNPNLRVIGLSATPYRLGSGYIYEIDEHDQLVPEQQTKDPYFKKLLCRVTAHELLEKGYLTPVEADHYDGYRALNLQLQKNGKFKTSDIEQAFEGQGRKTAQIVREVLDISVGKMGVMFFAATIQHAKEIMESLPPENSRIVTGKTKDKERDQIINDFKARRFKYLVNVAVLTTGFDAPHVDVVAILRATESVGLLQQIIGRGLRLHDDKKVCLVLDYAENIERHCPDGDIFNPEIKASMSDGEGRQLQAVCPDCGFVNEFTARKNEDGLDYSEDGYFVDLAGNKTEMPSHYGRRCTGLELVKGVYERCSYRWTIKECPECEHENDIAARYCEKCKAEIVDPNISLVLQYRKIKRDPASLSTDKVLSWTYQEKLSQKGNRTIFVEYLTDYRKTPVWYTPKMRSQWKTFCFATIGRVAEDTSDWVKSENINMPTTITARKEDGFFKIYNYNGVEDEVPEMA